MKIHPQFKHHLPPQASVRRADINAIMAEKPIELPFIKANLTLWQRIKKQLTK